MYMNKVNNTNIEIHKWPQDSNNIDNMVESTTNSFQHKKEGNHQQFLPLLNYNKKLDPSGPKIEYQEQIAQAQGQKWSQ